MMLLAEIAEFLAAHNVWLEVSHTNKTYVVTISSNGDIYDVSSALGPTIEAALSRAIEGWEEDK